MPKDLSVLSGTSAFPKLDAEDGELFYQPPRLVCDVDDGAIAS